MKSGILKGLAGALALVGGASCGQSPEQPLNVVYILADDLGYGDIGCYGQRIIQTPHIDQMAREGMLFTQHYAGCTVSAPSRCSLMTGSHTGHSQIRGNREVRPEGQAPMREDTYTIARLMKSAGYATGLFGKWGLGNPGSVSVPNKMGFDEFYGYNCQRQAHSYYPDHLWHNEERVSFPENLNKTTLSGVIMTYLAISLALTLYQYLSSTARQICGYVGSHTFILLVFSPIFTMAVKPLADILRFDPSGILFMIVALLITLAGCFSIAWLIDRLHLSPYFWGKKRMLQPFRQKNDKLTEK